MGNVYGIGIKFFSIVNEAFNPALSSLLKFLLACHDSNKILNQLLYSMT